MGKPKKGKSAKVPQPKPQEPQAKPEMCVFAFRLPAKERDRIHQAAQKITGKSGGATRFVVESVTKAVEKVLGS